MRIIQFLRDYSIVLMFATFAMLLLVTFWPGRRARFEHDSRIPLQDDPHLHADR